MQENLPRKAELAWQVSRYLWRGSLNFNINSRPLVTIIFKLKIDNFKTWDFSSLIERVLAGVEGLILWAYLFLRTWTTVAAPLSQMNMKGQLHPLRTQFQANQAIINKLSNSSLKKHFFKNKKKSTKIKKWKSVPFFIEEKEKKTFNLRSVCHFRSWLIIVL